MNSHITVRGNGTKIVKVMVRNNGVVSAATLRNAFHLESNVVVGLFNDEIALDCSRDNEDFVFHPPQNWIGSVFELTWDETRRSRPTTLFSEDARPISPYYPALPPDPAPSSEAIIKWMFFLHDHMGKATTICVHPRFFVTFRHGTHLQFKLGDKLTMYNGDKEVNEQAGVNVCVVKVHEAFDFVLLKSEFDVVERGPSIALARESELFTLAGFGNEQGSLSYLPGAIHSVRDFYMNFEGNAHSMGPFILGTSQSSRGDSVKNGGGVWGSRGLIGMNIGCTTMPLQFHHLAISEAAVFSPKNIISPAFRFKDAYMEELEKERIKEKVASPPQKKPHYMAEFDGIGTAYGSLK